jgi:hypothetical protein
LWESIHVMLHSVEQEPQDALLASRLAHLHVLRHFRGLKYKLMPVHGRQP